MATLTEQEYLLREKLQYVELLGELNLTPEGAKGFSNWVASCVERYGTTKAFSYIKDKYASCLAIYLVTKGIYGYQEGNYWSSVSLDIGVNIQSAQQQLGPFFEQFLQEHSLPVFPGLGGRRYVDIILLHGGIPNYSLTDFFTHILHPAIERPELYGANAREIIATWIDGGSLSHVDKPILRFLRYGGKLAIDFLDRSLIMGQHYSERGVVLHSKELGLPQRVVEEYRRWVKDQAHIKRISKTRLSRPDIVLDPWGGNLLLDLPSQILASAIDAEGSAWHVLADRTEYTLPLHASWRNEHWETDSYQLELRHPAFTYQMTFTGPEVKRTWQFQGIAPEAPLLVFEPDNGSLVPLRETLSAKIYWLLHPCHLPLEVDGGMKREDFPELLGEWSLYQAEEWDLSRATTIKVGKVNITVEPDASALQPILKGEEVTGLLHTKGEPRLFVRTPPEIHIPIPPHRDPRVEAERWHVSIHGNQEISKSLSHLPYLIEQVVLRLPLASEELLGPKAIGSFEIALRGPLGRDALFSIAVVSTFDIHEMNNQDRIRFPDGDGLFPTPQFSILTDGQLVLEGLDSALQIKTRQPGFYQVQVPAEETQVAFVLRGKNAAASIKIPFTYPLPIVRWAVIEGRQVILKETVWQTNRETYPRAWLEQADMPRLLVAITPSEGQDSRLWGRLLVHYDQERDAQILEPRGQTQKWLTFHLGEAIDSIRSSHEGSILVELEMKVLPDQLKAAKIPVIHYMQKLDIDRLNLENCIVDDTWMLALHWQGGRQLHNRVVRFWSLWQPWTAPVERAIPDSAQQGFDTEVPCRGLPPGRYCIEMAVCDPWSSRVEQRPIRHSSGTIEVMLGSPEEQGDYLATLEGTQGSLGRALAASTPLSSLQELHTFDAQFQIQDVRAAFESLLVLQQQIIDSEVLGKIFAIFQRHLVKAPVDVLALAATHSLGQEQPIRWQFEELLSKLAPGLGLEQLLNQIHQTGCLSLEELRPFMPTKQIDSHTEAEIFALFLDAGVRFQETESATHLPDTQKFADINELYEGISEYYLDSVRQYLQEVSKFPLLSAEQERRLAQQIREGKAAEIQQQRQDSPNQFLQKRIEQGRRAYAKLANANLRLVVSIAKKYMNRGLELLDVIQEGNIGLMHAIDKFDGFKGYRFSTYATWWIRQAITRALAEQTRMVRLPVYVVEEINRLSRTRKAMILEIERDPTDEELAEKLALPVGKVRELQTIAQDHFSLDNPVGEDEETTLGDLIAQEDSDPLDLFTKQEISHLIALWLGILNQRQRLILELRFGIHDDVAHTLEEIGKELGVTRERVRQIEEKALKKLRNSIKEDVSKFELLSGI